MEKPRLACAIQAATCDILRPLATTFCHFRPLAPTGACSHLATCGHLRPAATCGHSSGCKWLPCTCPRGPLQPAATFTTATCSHLRPLATARVAASGCPALALETPCGHSHLRTLAATCGRLLRQPPAATCGHLLHLRPFAATRLAASGCVFEIQIARVLQPQCDYAFHARWKVKIRFAAVALRWRRLSSREAGGAAKKTNTGNCIKSPCESISTCTKQLNL